MRRGIGILLALLALGLGCGHYGEPVRTRPEAAETPESGEPASPPAEAP